MTISQSTRAAIRMAPTVVLATTPEQTTLPSELSGLPTVVADIGIDVDRVLAAIEPEPAPVDDDSGVERAPDLRRLVCVCDADSRSRAFVVLRAVAMLAPRHPELRLLLVGPGVVDAQLRMHAAALGIHRVVDYRVGDGEVTPGLASADLGWVVADGDDGAFGVLDFMAAAVPVFAQRGSVAARYIADNITGRHLEPGDVPGTAAALAALLARADDRSAMGSAGRARVVRAYGEAAMLDGFARAAAAAAANAERGRVAAR
jgi:glycosyltransferase involved in cell wall biosynthesis